MQTFICPECGHESTYDPWVESAHCPACGYIPQVGMRISDQQPAQKAKAPHQPFLDELQAHWNGTHTPDQAFMFKTPEAAQMFFQEYLEAVGAKPHLVEGSDAVEYAHNYHPTQEEVLAFVAAYLWLRRGERAKAAQRLRALTKTSPRFADTWVWLSATTDDPAERIDYLGNAVVAEPEHTLAQDALVMAREGGE